MLAKAAAAHATVFPVSINLIGQFGTFEAREAFLNAENVGQGLKMISRPH